MSHIGQAHQRVTARAYANIALCKYWGKLPGEGNIPATPSIGLALRELATTTTVVRGARNDQLVLNGKTATPAETRRLSVYLDIWRDRGLLDGAFRVESTNSFPTAGGLASSAGGFAALVAALNLFTPRRQSLAGLSRLARQGSGSAARSILGGLSALPPGADPAAKQLLPAGEVPWWMVIAVMDRGKKPVGSRPGMKLSRETSPFYNEWMKAAARDYRRLIKLLKDPDLEEIGPVVEANMLAMHACILAARPAPLYWTPGTIAVLEHLRNWRRDGLSAWATIDAGPHVAVLCRARDVKSVKRRLLNLANQTTGILQVLASPPAGPPEIISVE